MSKFGEPRSRFDDYIEKVVDYVFKHSHKDSTYIIREKRFMNECLDLIDLTVFPNVSRLWIDEKRAFVMSVIENGTYKEHKSVLDQHKNEFRSMARIPDTKFTEEQRYTFWAVCSLFSCYVEYGASGDPVIESFAESMWFHLPIDEDVVATLLYKHFSNIIETT